MPNMIPSSSPVGRQNVVSEVLKNKMVRDLLSSNNIGTAGGATSAMDVVNR